MRTSLFSQSLFALPLAEAIRATADAGYSAIELACAEPHFGLETAAERADEVAAQIREAGLTVSALSLFNQFTDRDRLAAEIASAERFIGLAPAFGTGVVKLTPGGPASADATDEHWSALAGALDALVPMAEEMAVRFAFETHMRHLTDTLASTLRFLQMAPADAAGLTVDFSNLAFAGEPMAGVVSALAGRIVHTHIKNGTVDADGGWHFAALDTGLTDYAEVLPLLRDSGYDGYLSIECLQPEARTRPAETARRDLALLEGYLAQV